MKIIVAGEWTFDIYEKAMAAAFERLGHQSIAFSVSSFFGNAGRIAGFWNKLQYKFITGPAVSRLNHAFLQMIREEQPELVFVYRGNYFLPATIRTIRESMGAKVVVYNNDDPFGKHPAYMWRNLMDALPYYDHVFAYRQKNISDYAERNIFHTSLLRSYYRKENNFPIADLQDRKYVNGICFIGHYEDDGRDEYLKHLLDNGVPLNIYGPFWEKSPYYDLFTARMKGPVRSLTSDYNLCINSNDICLVFLSHKNNDTYTRRCFEIPATATCMISVYTDDLNGLFTEDVEAVYFRNKEELLEKTIYYLDHHKERERIAKAGYERLLADGHEVTNRASQVLATYHKMNN